ncbi:MAG: hypothetical protein KDA79_06015 [Planctomycetaceae bacterium]|nr:hypothetical protein [Planctomycetaceae bacterium]
MNLLAGFLPGELVQLVRRWWRAGRIRISPREGELLQLRTGDIVEFDGRRLEVQSWSLRDGPETTASGKQAGPDADWKLQLDCMDVSEERTELERNCRLLIVPAAAGTTGYCGSPLPPLVWLQEADQPARQLAADEVTVWCRQ